MIFFLLCRDLLPPLARGTDSSFPTRRHLWRNNLRLLIGYKLPNVFGFGNRHQRRLAQMSLALFPFAGQQVTLESFVPFDLAAARDPESLSGGSVGFDLRH
jgi:hypothetical protein